jgi:hypothetical protein
MIDEPFPFEKVFGGIAGFMLYATMIIWCENLRMGIILTAVYLLVIYLIFFAPGRRDWKKREKNDDEM